ncbi:unnamed protein product [Heterobilharzia americana]|nr:unnamed protein product [Heterobilharzia americana]
MRRRTVTRSASSVDKLGKSQVPVLYVYSPSGEKIIEFPLVKKHVTIGRDPSCDICIKSSSFLSREHGVFELNENYFCTITDLGSLNGITRNNLQLKPRISYELRDGDYLCFGDIYCTLRFCPSNMKVGLNTTFDHESCMEHNETLVQTNLSTDQKDSSGSDDADSSVLSEGVLTEIVVDTNDVSRDLLPNPVYFLPSRSHSLSNSLDSDCKKNDGTHSLSDSSQSRMHDNKHVSDNEINQDSGAKLFVGVTRQHTEKTSLESSIKSLKTRCSSGEIIPTVTMTLLSGASSTPLVCSRSNMILARDSDPGCIDQSIDNHLTSNAPSSTCLSIDESGLIIEESDLVTTISMKRA